MDAPQDYVREKDLRELKRIYMDLSKKKYDWEKELRARELKRQEWEQYKESIKTLYLTDGITLKELRRLMYERHGFYATETQYKKRISTVWNIQKNVPTEKMKKIIRIVYNRLYIEGKQTAVAWHGKLLNQEKIDRSKTRFEKTGRYRNSGSHVDTPSSVTYWTPKLFTPVLEHDFASPCISVPPIPHWLGPAANGDDIGLALDTTKGAEAAIDSLHFDINNLEHGDHGNRGPAVQPPYDAADPRETIHQTPETFLPDDGNWDELFELFSTEHDNLLESIPSLPDIQPHHSPLGQVSGGGLSALSSNHNSETGITTRSQRPDADNLGKHIGPLRGISSLQGIQPHLMPFGPRLGSRLVSTSASLNVFKM